MVILQRGVNEKMTEPGYLCLQKSLPGMGRGITSICKQTFEQEYFSTWKGSMHTLMCCDGTIQLHLKNVKLIK